MVKHSIRVEAAKARIAGLNSEFHSKSLLTDAFYRQLMQAGCAYYKSVLVSLWPDGFDTYVGQLIRQDGRVFDFDVDLRVPELSSWTDVTNDFRNIYERYRKTKPWKEEVVALDLFRELEAKQSSK